MKKTILIILAMVCISTYEVFSQEYMQVTTIESVVPGGFGRSKMITQNAAGEKEEVELENFFSLVGINFGNVRKNDKTITDKITELAKAGWNLTNVTPGVYSSGAQPGGGNGTGIFITRYLFKKEASK